MIVESLVDLCLRLLVGVFDTITLVPLPVALLDVLYDILVYGTWVVGADYMAIFIASVVGWAMVRFTVGLVVFLWELLPLT